MPPPKAIFQREKSQAKSAIVHQGIKQGVHAR
jgi:hypothetical protein